MATLSLDEMKELMGVPDEDEKDQDKAPVGPKESPAQKALLSPMNKPDAPVQKTIPDAMAAPEVPNTSANALVPSIGQPQKPKQNTDRPQILPSMQQGETPGAYEQRQGETHLDQHLYDVQHPWGTPGNHDTTLGKVGHVLGRIGNIAGDVLVPNLMSDIPGTDANRNMRMANDVALIGKGSEDQAKTAEANNQQSEADARKNPKPELLPGDDNTRTDSQGNREQAYKFPDGSKKWIPEGQAPGQQQPSTPVQAASVVPPITPGASSGQIVPKIPTGQGPSTTTPLTPSASQYTYGSKPSDETKLPVGDAGAQRHSQELDTLTSGMPQDDKKKFMDAYSVNPTDTLAVQTKRLEDAKASAQLSAGERDRAIQRDTAKKNHEDSQANTQAVRDAAEAQRDLETVQFKNKDGELVIGSLTEAKEDGDDKTARKVSPAEEQKARDERTQYQRWIDNAQAASDSMGAWDNPNDKKLAIAVKNAFFNHVGIDPWNVGASINTAYIDAFQNNHDYAQMSPEGQKHMQNMATVWSDAINLMKSETGGVPRGEQFLRLESTILPQPEKTQDMNRQALGQFEQRIKKDATQYPRPTDMPRLGGVIPPDATSRITNNGAVVGYRDKAGKVVRF